MCIKILVTDGEDVLFCKNLQGQNLRQITIKTDEQSMSFLTMNNKIQTETTEDNSKIEKQQLRKEIFVERNKIHTGKEKLIEG